MGLLIALVALGSLAAGFSFAVWRLARLGRGAVVVAWLAASALLATLYLLRIQSVTEGRALQALSIDLAVQASLMGLLGFGLAARSLWRRFTVAPGALTGSAIGAAVGAFYLGVLLSLLPALFRDIGRLGS